jgi:hypothetical protein
MILYLVRHGIAVDPNDPKSPPEPERPLTAKGVQKTRSAALDGQRRRQARLLTSLLRIAEKLESEHAQRISGVDVQISGRKAIFIIRALDGTRLDLLGLERKSDLFEKEFHLKTEFRRAQGKEKVA